MHLHSAPPLTNGPVVFGLTSLHSDLNNDLDTDNGKVFSAWDLLEGFNTTLSEQLPSLLRGNLYLNIHTIRNPAGELRGQVSRVPEPSSLLLMGLGLLGLAVKNCRR